MKTEEIIIRLKKGDPVGLAKAITLVENRRGDFRQILASIYPMNRRALRIGVTGAPGSGKSTLVEKLLSQFKNSERSLAVLAIDPSSPLTGGALLGDRIRMIEHSLDPRVFIRSMASRGCLGGLSAAASEILDLLEAAGKEIILIETVGVGQSEIDVVNVSDLVLSVLTPQAGDEIQIFKAGLIEVTDIFVINKSDLGGAENKIVEIQNYFHTSDRSPIITPLSAKTGEGVDRLAQTILSLNQNEEGFFAARKIQFARNQVIKIIQESIREEILSNPRYQTLLDSAERHNLFFTAEAIFDQLFSGDTKCILGVPDDQAD